MADKTFRQTVEEILFQLYGNMEPCESCLERGGCTKTPIQCALDRICNEVDRLAKRMPKRYRYDYKKKVVNPAYGHYCDGAKSQYEKYQAYWRKQVE